MVKKFEKEACVVNQSKGAGRPSLGGERMKIVGAALEESSSSNTHQLSSSTIISNDRNPSIIRE